MTNFDPRRVFGSRVDSYIKFRPGYPGEVVDTLVQACGLNPEYRVADIGSGTGLLARLFLDLGCTVVGVEPNQEMRQAGEQILAVYSDFTSMSGSAEDTGLANGSIDLISAGMAFHWFNVPRAKDEFRRILTPNGWVALVWNRMLTGPSSFMQEYSHLILETSPGWTETLRRDLPGSGLDLPGFFNNGYHRATFPNHQRLDWKGLYGRTISIAHVPQPDDPVHTLMFTRLGNIFERHQEHGWVEIQYETELYFGHVE